MEKGEKIRRILVFAGTTEGRELVKFLNDFKVQVTVCTATEYGRTCIKEQKNVETLPGRLERAEIVSLIRKRGIELAVDATHPFAVQVTEYIHAACQ